MNLDYLVIGNINNRRRLVSYKATCKSRLNVISKVDVSYKIIMFIDKIIETYYEEKVTICFKRIKLRS